jgi:hypothetical protein
VSKLLFTSAGMSTLFDNLAVLDRKLANRWKIRTRDNVRHVLSVADVDFILVDLFKSEESPWLTKFAMSFWTKSGRRLRACCRE